MGVVLWVVNLVACCVVFAVAMFFYLRHGKPETLHHHFNQSALLALSVGAFAALISAWRGMPTVWWEVLFRLGVALLAARSWWRWLEVQRHLERTR